MRFYFPFTPYCSLWVFLPQGRKNIYQSSIRQQARMPGCLKKGFSVVYWFDMISNTLVYNNNNNNKVVFKSQGVLIQEWSKICQDVVTSICCQWPLGSPAAEGRRWGLINTSEEATRARAHLDYNYRKFARNIQSLAKATLCWPK